MKNSFLKKAIMGAVVGLGSALLVWFLVAILFKPFFFRMEAQTYDWRLQKKVDKPKSPIDEVIIIDIDARSVNKLGKFHQWPRTWMAKLVNYLRDSGVKMIGTDIIFDPDPRHPEEDKALQDAIRKSGIVCSALYFAVADSAHFLYVMSQEPDGMNYQKIIKQVPPSLYEQLIPQERIDPQHPEFINASETAGYVNLLPDPDGLLRRIPAFLRFNDHVYPSFSMQIAMKALKTSRIEYDEKKNRTILVNENGENVVIPMVKRGQFLINYEGPYQTFRYISFYDALMQFIPAEYFKGKIVLIGTSLPGLFDLRATPLQAAYPGVEVNANVIYQLLNGKFTRQMTETNQLIFLLVVGLVAGLLLAFRRLIGSIIITLILSAGVIYAGFYFLNEFAYWMPMVPPIMTVVLAFSSNYVYRYLFEEKDKRQIRKVFSHYVSPSVVEVLLKHPEKVGLGGDRKFCTAFFSDVAGFTTISEQMSPEKLVTLLNEYLTEMTNIVISNQGMLDKYEGDAIMAVFGAPVEMPEHAELACRSALQMQTRLEKLRLQWEKEGKPALHCRIGINSGDMVVGNMGSHNRFDYTVLGDSVNLASRLEGANKLYDTKIMIGEETYNLVKDKFVSRPLDLLRVKGKNKPVKVYELIAENNNSLPQEFLEMLKEYNEGFENYLKCNWEWAANHFRQVLQIQKQDGPSRLYLLRCQEFQTNPPSEDWDGVFTMKTK